MLQRYNDHVNIWLFVNIEIKILGWHIQQSGVFFKTILSQSSNTTRKGPDFYMANCCRAVYVGNIVQLILKNLYRTENTLSGAWFCQLLSDWSKTLFGSQDLVSCHKIKKSLLTHTPTLGQ